MKNKNIMTTTFLSLAVVLLTQCGIPSANSVKPQSQHNANTQQDSLQHSSLQLKSKTADKSASDSSAYDRSTVSITYYNKVKDQARIEQIINKYAKHTADPALIIAIAHELRGLSLIHI